MKSNIERTQRIAEVEKEFNTSFKQSDVEVKYTEDLIFILVYKGLKVGYSKSYKLDKQSFESDIEKLIIRAIRQEQDFIKYQIENSIATRTLFIQD